MKNIISFIILVIISYNVQAQGWVNSQQISSSESVTSKEILIENGNIYAAGLFTGSIGDTLDTNGSNDWFLAKYNSDFSLSWIKKIGGIGQERDVSMALSSGNNILIGGSFRNTCYFTSNDSLISDGLYDIMLAKYNSVNGNLLWKDTIAWGESGQLIASLDVDINNEIIVTGFYKDSLITSIDTIRGSGFQNFIMKLDENGDCLWVKNILSSNTSTRISAVSAFKDAYFVSGTYLDSIFFDNDTLIADTEGKAKAFIYKLGYNGTSLWSRSSYGDDDDATGTVAQDNYGNIYLSGYYRSSDFRFDSTAITVSNSLVNNGGSDLFIAKYNKSGNLLWLQGYGKTGSDYAIDIKENDGILYFTGYYSDSLIINGDTLFNSNTSNKDLFLGTADSKGNLLKGVSLNGTGVFDDWGVSLEISDDIHAFLMGDFYSPSITIGENTLNNSVSPNSSVFIAEYVPEYIASITEKKNITCGKGTDGRLVVTPYFGVSPYTYEWSHNGTLNDSVATGLSAGPYFVTITDALSSEAITSVELTEPDTFLFNPNITQVTSCSYSAEGAIDLNVTGGNGDNIYYWFESNGGSGVSLLEEDQTGLTTGQYCVTVTDKKGCTADTIIYITGPDTIVFTGTTVTHINNIPVSQDGAVNIAVAGGTEPYASYTWTGPNFTDPGTKDISGLTEGGLYSVTVTDDNACTADTSVSVIDSTQLFIYFKEADITNVSCNSLSDGEATITSIGYTGTLSYSWSHNPGLNSATATGLGAGKYLITVTDSDAPGNPKTDSVTITEPLVLNTSTIVSPQLDCNGDATGYVDLTVSGGTIPYTYNWSTGAKTQDIAGVIADTYNVTVTDANACEETDNATITEATAIIVNILPIIDPRVPCFGDNDEQLTASPTGGTPPYEYAWDDPGLQRTQTATDMPAGYFTVTVTDDNGCEETKSKTITQPRELVVEAEVYDITCNNENDGSVLLNVSGGTPQYYYFWTTKPPGSGIIATDKNQSELSEGRYYFTVTDVNNCEFEDSVDIVNPPAITIDSESKTDASASTVADGSVTVTASGGTGTLDYTLKPDNITNSTGVFNSLLPGDYTVEVTDDNTCGPVTSSSLKVSSPDGIDDYLNNKTIRIYPNPVSDRLFVKTEYEGDFTFQLVNVSGGIVYTKNVNLFGKENIEELDVANYPKGIYFIRIYNKEVNINRKIIIQ